MIIPNKLVIIVAGLAMFQISVMGVFSAIILFTLGGFFYFIYGPLRKLSVLGLGDVKLMTASGLWFTPEKIPIYLIIIGCSGIFMGLIWNFIIHKPGAFPFAPALSLGLFLTLFFRLYL